MISKIHHSNSGYSDWKIEKLSFTRAQMSSSNGQRIVSPEFRCERNKQWHLVLHISRKNLQVYLSLRSNDSSPFDLSGSYAHFVDDRGGYYESRIEFEKCGHFYVFKELRYNDIFLECNGMTTCSLLILRFCIDAKIIINASYNSKLQEEANGDSTKSNFEILVNNPDLSDIQLVVGENKFFAHKAILANSSSVFVAMFKNDFKEGNQNVVKISDMSAEAVGSLLNYMYTRTASINENIVIELLMASDKYLINSLKKSCEKYLLDTLTIENCLKYVLAAHTFDMNELKGEIIVFIGRNCNRDFMNSEPFIELQKSHLKLYAEIGQHFINLVLRSK